MNSLDCDLAIVGGGIAGPALAAALAKTNAKIALIERSSDPLDTARGDHLQPATCEHLERWGVLDMMLASGAEKRLGARWETSGGEEVLDVRVDNLDISHPYFVYLNHELISDVLLTRARQNTNFHLVRPATARIASNDGDHSLIAETNGDQMKINARCIAVADGRASRGRKALDIDVQQHNYDNPLLVLFAERTFDDKRNNVHVFLTADGILSVVPRIRNHWKIGIPLPRAAINEWKKASPEALADRITTLAPKLSGIRPKLSGVYPVAMINAARWVDANCVLLGDACHALHPGRSQGMNVAMRTVAALADKLIAADFKDPAANVAAVLADFEAEFRPAVDARLEANHARGLDMDRMDSAGVERTIAGLSAVAASPEKTRAYCMNAAGY